jgi:hypothetical protein
MKSKFKSETSSKVMLITPETHPDAYTRQKRGKFGRTVRRHSSWQPNGLQVYTGQRVKIKPPYVSVND